MKAFLWLMVIALAILCSCCWLFAHLVVQYLIDFRSAYVVPAFTRLVLMPHSWLLFCPVPWVAWAAVLSARREVSQGAVLIFAGVITIAMVLIFSAVGLAAYVGVVPFKL